MDTVYNDETTGPFIQTFKFVKSGVLFGILHETKTARSMKEGIDMLESLLGTETFRKYVNVLLTDRGTEFTAADAIEAASDGTRRTRIFYCDPMQSGQKGTLENKHIELRYILPKGVDLRALGLTDQNSLNLVLCHINSIYLFIQVEFSPAFQKNAAKAHCFSVQKNKLNPLCFSACAN